VPLPPVSVTVLDDIVKLPSPPPSADDDDALGEGGGLEESALGVPVAPGESPGPGVPVAPGEPVPPGVPVAPGRLDCVATAEAEGASPVPPRSPGVRTPDDPAPAVAATLGWTAPPGPEAEGGRWCGTPLTNTAAMTAAAVADVAAPAATA
jgi:hypothetical protein